MIYIVKDDPYFDNIIRRCENHQSSNYYAIDSVQLFQECEDLDMLLNRIFKIKKNFSNIRIVEVEKDEFVNVTQARIDFERKENKIS